MKARRLATFRAMAGLLGFGPAASVAQGWAKALASPEARVDLGNMGFLFEPDVRMVDGRPAPLPPEELAFRAGARAVVTQILDRADMTHADVTEAMQEMDDADDVERLARGDRA